MTQQLVDKNGNPVTTKKEVIADLNEPEGIKLSQIGMAMLDVLVAAQMLNMYAAQNILKEAPDSIDEIQKVVNDEMEKMGEFTIEHVKQHLMMAFQVTCTHLAEIHANRIVQEGIEETRRRVNSGEFESVDQDNTSDESEDTSDVGNKYSESDTEDSDTAV